SFKLTVTVEQEKVQEAIRKSYKKNVKSLSVQGFRKGKAPLAIIKQFYGIEVLLDDAADFILQEAYPKALKEAGVEPVDHPEIDINQLEEGKEFIFTAKVDVYPEFDLPELTGLNIEKPVIKVTDHDVDHEIEHMVEKNGRIESKEEGAELAKGDVAVLDFLGKIDGVPFQGGKAENFELEIGSGSFIGDFEDQLVGLKVGEEKTVKVTFPADYNAEELQNKDAEFDVKIHDIKAKEYPEVDDEFASEVSEFETLEELKANIREGLEKDAEARAKNELQKNLITAVAEKVEIDIPEAMVESTIDRSVQDFEQRIAQQGINKEMYLQMTGQDEGAIREMFRDNAKTTVKNDLIIEKIMEVKDIEASEEEVNAKVEEIAEMYGDQKEEIKEMLLKSNRYGVEMEVKTGKVFDLLLEHANVTEKEITVSHDHSHEVSEEE
ncbi:MAG: trigger factor, partial [Tissierellia bacterium]|nr:trigger factor [Tissierellia bacterium]